MQNIDQIVTPFMEACAKHDCLDAGRNVPIQVLLDFAKSINFRDVEMFNVRTFNTKFGLMINSKPSLLTHRKIKERLEFIFEEFLELVSGAGHVLVAEDRGDGGQKFVFADIDEQNIYEQADALIDLVYVIKGTALMMGLPWEELWADVQRANMAKERGVSKRGHLVDCIKLAGWEGPKTQLIIDSAGFDSNEGGKDDYNF